MPNEHPSAIHWVRRDLRIADNRALYDAARSGSPVIPVYFVSDWKKNHAWTGPKRQQFLCGSIKALAKNIEALGGRLIIRHEEPIEGLHKLIKETRARAVHYQKDPDPHGKHLEKQLEQTCRDLGVACHGHLEVAIHGPNEVLTQADKPYRVYTPYCRTWLSLDKPQPLGKPESFETPQGVQSEDLPDLNHWELNTPDADILEPGERAARKRLQHAVHAIVEHYDQRRNHPALDGTSRISQDLRFGLISARSVYSSALAAKDSANQSGRRGIDTFIKELAWREFYFAILHHFPKVLEQEFNSDWQGLPWEGPGKPFDLWKSGHTGFPIVDAGMRELLATGFMHNRVRMITAMFLTKDLHLDWRLGESHFMQHLIDGEIASNNGGWQWSAGTGADAAPYFRIQNPWTQSERYDPKGKYIKRWVPELENCDPKQFHQAPKDDKPIADDYPLPCVDHKTEREKTLQIFKRHRNQQR